MCVSFANILDHENDIIYTSVSVLFIHMCITCMCIGYHVHMLYTGSSVNINFYHLYIFISSSGIIFYLCCVLFSVDNNNNNCKQ